MTRKAPENPLPNRCVLVADGARARFFTIVEPTEDEGGSRLLERDTLINPEGDLPDKEIFSDVRSGRKNRSSVVGGGYSTDAGNARWREESYRRFAREISVAAQEFVASRKAGTLIIAATPRFLGFLRPEIRKAFRGTTEFVELAAELSSRPVSEIENVLVRHGALREQAPAAGIYRPRAQPAPASARRRS